MAKSDNRRDNSESLGQYKGFPITSTKIIVNSLGDGLSKAVNVQPRVIEFGVATHLAVRMVKTKDRYDAVTREDGTVISYELVQIFSATGAAFSDDKVVQTSVRSMLDLIAEEEELARGQLPLDIGDLPGVSRIHGDSPDVANQVDDAMSHLK